MNWIYIDKNFISINSRSIFIALPLPARAGREQPTPRSCRRHFCPPSSNTNLPFRSNISAMSQTLPGMAETIELPPVPSFPGRNKAKPAAAGCGDSRDVTENDTEPPRQGKTGQTPTLTMPQSPRAPAKLGIGPVQILPWRDQICVPSASTGSASAPLFSS